MKKNNIPPPLIGKKQDKERKVENVKVLFFKEKRDTIMRIKDKVTMPQFNASTFLSFSSVRFPLLAINRTLE